MQNRRHFLQTGFSMAAAGIAGAAALAGARRTRAEEAPPETTSLRLAKVPSTCLAPLYILDDLLREEGFTDINYVSVPWIFTPAEVDFGQDFSAPNLIQIEAGKPVVALAGVHLGCFELFARESIRGVVDLKGKKVGVSTPGVSADYVVLSVVAASVGLDPARDINWIAFGSGEPESLLVNDAIDAFLAIPPFGQELRARKSGHVILNSGVDRPWSQYVCCMLLGNADFVRRNPIATKRVVRAMMRATDICAAKPDWVARRLVDRGFTPRYDYARQGLEEVSYRSWRDYDAEDAIRFWALRLREVGMIKSSPDKIIAQGTDWRFIREVRKELGI
ncbi:MAG: ABC transporter substrate-binding protein [Hyphomicrobiales bacterium]|nr:ABC transporter substrate-binding protein [Hyphomicrobiales bacterium]